MRCPYCGSDTDRVVDTRSRNKGRMIRRRRQCLDCNRRFTTVEAFEDEALYVIKSDGRSEPYARDKLLKGIQIACIKRPVTLEQMETIIDQVESEINAQFIKEIQSRQIGELVMNQLRLLDEVAYVRFASVYRQFQDTAEFERELKQLKTKRQKSK